MLTQSAFINGSDLLQQDHGILAQTYTATGNVDMGGQPGLSRLAGDGRGDDRGRMAVSRIILHDQDRAGAALFAPNNRR